MATLRSKRKLAALNKENCKKQPRSNLAQNWNLPRSQEDYITQVSEEIEGRVTNKLSQEFSRTESRFLGALSCLDDFLLKPLIQGHSRTAPEHTTYKPGNEWGRLPEWSSSWSGYLSESDNKLWPRWHLWQLQGRRTMNTRRRSLFDAHIYTALFQVRRMQRQWLGLIYWGISMRKDRLLNFVMDGTITY